MKSAGLLLVLVGLALVVVGLLAWSGALSWFGRLPGDLQREGEHTRVYVPLTSMLVSSMVLSLSLSQFREPPRCGEGARECPRTKRS